jgi:acyl-coenzyme A synthetase/AMP-(fatty) acid ligase
MIFDAGANGVEQLTYSELWSATERFAAMLAHRGLHAGDRLLIRLPNVRQFPVAFLGALKAGVVAVPVSTQLKPGELGFVARDSGARGMVSDETGAAVLAGCASENIRALEWIALTPLTGNARPEEPLPIASFDLEKAMQDASSCAPKHVSLRDDPAYLVYTSGTSGKAKGVLHAHRSLLGRLPAARDWFGWHPEGDRVLHCGRLNWTYVLGSALMDPLFKGHTVVVQEGPATAETWVSMIQRHRPSIFMAVPAIYRAIVERTAAHRADLASVRHCMSAGDNLTPALVQAWRDRFGMDIHEALGMTELSYYVSHPPGLPVRLGSVGRPQQGRVVRVVDPDNLAPREVLQQGMVAVAGSDAGLFLRYWGEAGPPAEMRESGWFLTGDWGYFDEDGYLWLAGRRDDQINSLGHRVSPLEVEHTLTTHAGVRECACTGETVAAGQIVVAYVVPSHDRPDAALADELLEFVSGQLARYKAPRIIYLVAALPKTTNGKVQRRRLVASMAFARSGAPTGRRPETASERVGDAPQSIA